MADLKTFRAEIEQKFRDNIAITTFGFYGQYPTPLLEKVRAGFEQHYDAACQGDPHRPPLEWLQKRIKIITRILEDREADRPRTPEEKMWDKVENGTAKRVQLNWKSKSPK
ncbi:hypothetical protein [Spirosoma oryzicola]|uniref:hypothetical protein n=1 Tax=Spirosoma oryzicola TaxID=2898794 RepID=UPI001E3795D8|nr:hypothetical protein [Spirosoma oryzicola]UHG93349.1 hypothetical protein LQ777_10695 [Spirosoma oryzicola]